MNYVEPKELILTKQFINEGKFDEALRLMKNFEETGKPTLNEIVSCHLLKCEILFQQNLHKELFECAEQTYNESLRLGKSLLTIDALYYMAFPLIMSNNLEKAEDLIKHGEALLKTLTHELPKEYKQREASIEFLKGIFYHPIAVGEGDPDLALKILEQCLVLREEYDEKHKIAFTILVISWILLIYKGELDHAFEYMKRALTLAKEVNRKFTIAVGLNTMAAYYHFKGELDRSITLYKQSLMLFKELNNKFYIGQILNSLAEVYKMKGEIECALEYSEQSVAQFVEVGILRFTANAYDFLIQILIEKGDLERAQENLDQLEQMKNKLNHKSTNLLYLFDKALLLKSSNRVRDRGKAEEILRKILEDDPHYESKIRSLLHISELLLTELRMTGDLEVLEDINSYIAQLLDISEKIHSYWVLTEIYLLQAKISLLTFNIKKARRFLTQAQQIAERFNLNQLISKITSQKEDLLKKLDLWNKLKNVEASMADRFELAQLEEQISGMVQNRALLTTQVIETEVAIHEEKKICLVCRGEVLRFSYICECGAIYCENCARELTNLENICWVCDAPIDSSKPIKPYKEEGIVKIDKKKKKS
ncbi:MAG: hypothetical protein ACFFB0_08015 [Promethearchaeota archaeon]